VDLPGIHPSRLSTNAHRPSKPYAISIFIPIRSLSIAPPVLPYNPDPKLALKRRPRLALRPAFQLSPLEPTPAAPTTTSATIPPMAT
jgi:hypothetical protein